MDDSTDGATLRRALGLAPIRVPIGWAVSTPLTYPDGDRIAFYVRRDGAGWIVEDDGEAIPGYLAAGGSFARGGEARRLASRSGIDYDAGRATLSLRAAGLDAVRPAAMRLVGLLCRLRHPVLGMKGHYPGLFEGGRSETVA